MILCLKILEDLPNVVLTITFPCALTFNIEPTCFCFEFFMVEKKLDARPQIFLLLFIVRDLLKTCSCSCIAYLHGLSVFWKVLYMCLIIHCCYLSDHTCSCEEACWWVFIVSLEDCAWTGYICQLLSFIKYFEHTDLAFGLRSILFCMFVWSPCWL